MAAMFALARPCSQDKIDIARDGLNGPVRSVLLESSAASRVGWLLGRRSRIPVQSTSYNADGNRLETIRYDNGETKRADTEVCSYDSTGRLIKSILRQGSTTTTKLYRYNDVPRSLEIRENVVTDKESIDRVYISVFDDRGQQVESMYADTDIQLKALYNYIYDDSQRLRALETFNGEDVLYHRIVFNYDDVGRLSLEASYAPDGSMYEQRVYNYGIAERTEEESSFKDGTLLKEKTIYRYDDRENLIEVLAYDQTSALCGRTSHFLKYDELGNWVEKTTQSWEVKTGKPTATCTQYRMICYWQQADLI